LSADFLEGGVVCVDGEKGFQRHASEPLSEFDVIPSAYLVVRCRFVDVFPLYGAEDALSEPKESSTSAVSRKMQKRVRYLGRNKIEAFFCPCALDPNLEESEGYRALPAFSWVKYLIHII
jgi:hypothetical protein